MTGKHLKGLRDALGLEPFAWADVMGVHVATIYRWETSEVVKMDPLQRRIADALHHQLPAMPSAARKELGVRVRNALVAGGPLVGLYELLSFVTKETPHG
jgi:hypothetical protein